MKDKPTYRILILGSGGREHTFAWKLQQSPRCAGLWIAPGNGGTRDLAINTAIDPMNFEAIGEFCVAQSVDMLVVGPEAPLVGGIVDYFKAHPHLQHVLCIGPSKAGALLEGSKDLAKKFMHRNGIPTASYRSFTLENIESGRAYIAMHPTPIVLKADGLAAGKGVVICQSQEEALSEYEMMLDGKFGDAGSTVVIEQFLTGIEFSVFALTDGDKYVLLPIAKDYKRIGIADTGLNTGGMGAVSPVPFVDEVLMEKVMTRIITPTINGIRAEQIDYKGFVFFGLINVDGDPYVIEYNCRMGDPETESVIPRLQNDLVELFESTHNGILDHSTIMIDPRFATTVVCASGGYPGEYRTGLAIQLPEQNEDTMIFHAGTKIKDGALVTSGGRVFAVTALGDSMTDALKNANQIADAIQFEGKYYRKDIGFDL